MSGRNCHVFSNNNIVSPSVVSDCLWPPWTVYLARLLCPWDFPGKNTAVGSYYLLQEIKLITYNKLSNHSGQNGGTSYRVIGFQGQSTLSTRLPDMGLGSLQPMSQPRLLVPRGSCLWWGGGTGERLAGWGRGPPFLRVQSAPATLLPLQQHQKMNQSAAFLTHEGLASKYVLKTHQHQPACRSLNPSAEEQTLLRASALRDAPHQHPSFSLVPQRGGNTLQLLLWWWVSVLLFTFSALQTQSTIVSSFLPLPFFRPHCEAQRIIVPQPGIEPVPPAVEAQGLNHWTTREVPIVCNSFP